MSDVSKSLRLLTKMSDNEQFAQIAQRKGAIMSELLMSLTKNEQMSELLIFLSKSLISSFLDKKHSDSLGNQMSEFLDLVFGARPSLVQPFFFGFRFKFFY